MVLTKVGPKKAMTAKGKVEIISDATEVTLVTKPA